MCDDQGFIRWMNEMIENYGWKRLCWDLNEKLDVVCTAIGIFHFDFWC